MLHNLLHNILKLVASVTIGYLAAWCISNVLTHYELTQAKRRWETLRQQQESFEELYRIL